MPGFTLTEASDVLKNFYIGPIRKILNKSTVLLSQIKKDSTTQDVDGKNFTVPIHFGRNMQTGVGVDEGETLFEPSNQKYKSGIVPNKYVYARIQISGQVMKATKTNAGAFVRALDSELTGAVDDMKYNMNRQLNGDGKDALAFWTSADDTSPTVVDDGNGFAFTHLPVGQPLVADLIDAGDNTTKRGDSIVVTLGAESVAPVGYSVSWTGTVTASADGDYLVVENTLGRQLMGIEGIVNDNDPVVPKDGGVLTGLHGLGVVANPWWKAQIVGDDAAKQELSFPLMQRVISKIASGSSFKEKDIKFILCSYEMRDKYVELCTNERGWFNTMTFDGGFEAVEYNKIALIPDHQCKHGRLYFIVPESLRIMRTADFEWMGEDGDTLHRLENQDAYRATFFHYGDLAAVNRNANGLLRGINE